MASFKSHPFFYTTLLLAGGLAAGQAWLLYSQRASTRLVSAEIAQKQETLQAFARSSPFPSKENLTAVETDRAGVEKTRDEIRQRLRATGEVADKIAGAAVPASPTEAYFDIANFVELVRAEATAAGVEVAGDNRFGFSAFASTGPERDLIAPVFQQRQEAEYLLKALIAARPRSFVSLQRERPLTPAQKQQLADALASGVTPSSPSDNGGAGDYFTIDTRVSARVADFVETRPFRVTFTGYTKSLRDFLNELVTFKIPVVVRSVEVESLNTANAQTKSAQRPASNLAGLFGGGADSAVPVGEAAKALVEQNESRFIVTVEIVSLVDKNAASAPTP